MAPDHDSPKGGAKRGAEEANLDAQREDPARVTRRTRASGNLEAAGNPSLPERSQRTRAGTGPSGASAEALAPPSDEPPAQPQATNAPIEAQMNSINIVQELNALMLTLHSRAIENQQESSSLLAEITRLQTVYNAWVRDVILKNRSPATGEQPATAEAQPVAAQQQQQERLADLAKSVIYPGSQPLGGVAVDSEEHIAQIEHTTALVKAEIERLKIVLEEKRKAKLKQIRERGGKVTLTPELVALLEERHTPATGDVTHLPALSTAAMPAPIAQRPRPPTPAAAPVGHWVPRPATTQGNIADPLSYLPPSVLNMQAHSVLERRQSDLANIPSIDGFRNLMHIQQQQHQTQQQRQQREQQQRQPSQPPPPAAAAQPNDILQQLLRHAGLSPQYNNLLSNREFASAVAGPPRAADLAAALPMRPPPIRTGPGQQQQQQQQLSQQQLDLISTLAQHANIQISPATAPYQQQQQHQQAPSPGGEQDAQASANFAAMLLDMMATQGGGDGGYTDGMDEEDGQGER